MKLSIIILLLLIKSSLTAYAQKYLLMDKYTGKQRKEFYPGDELTFRLKGEEHFNTMVITQLQDSLIIFNGAVVNTREIGSIRVDRRSNGIKGASRTARKAGVGLFLIDQFNSLVITREPIRIQKEVLIVSSSLVALSYLIHLTQKKKFKIGGNRRLRIIDVSFK